MKNGRYEKYGEVRWFKDGYLHREDGPAYEGVDGNKHWYLNGKFHRVDGPAVQRSNGMRIWYVNGERHRLDGPAVEYSDGSKAWWVNGQYIDVLAIFGYEPAIPLSEEEQMVLLLSI